MSILTNFILLSYTFINTMNTDLQKIKQAADGLYFMSETDSPLVLFQLTEKENVEQQLLHLSGKESGAIVTQQELEYFLRNMVKTYPGADAQQLQTAQRFQQLQQLLHQVLTDVKVYRIGEVNVEAFIVGKLKDGSYAGLRTKLVET